MDNTTTEISNNLIQDQELLNALKELAYKFPNDLDLGREIRMLISVL